MWNCSRGGFSLKRFVEGVSSVSASRLQDELSSRMRIRKAFCFVDDVKALNVTINE